MSSNQKLGWAEFGRGWAALLVFIAHGFYVGVPKQYEFTFLWGRWGVCFFFVLSGFIISHVHSNDIGKPERTSNFLWRRFVRIFPTYWLALLIFLFVRNGLGNPDYRVMITGPQLAGNIIFWPGIPDMIVPMAWTLRHELLFYSLFAVTIVSRRLGFAILAIWLALLVWTLVNQAPCQMLTVAAQRCMAANSTAPPISPAWQILTLNVNLYFFVGIGLALAFRRGVIGRVALVSSGAWAAALAVDCTSESILALAFSQAAAFTALVSSAIWLSTIVTAPRLALWFGEISYVFYLFHMTMMLVAHGLLKRLPIQVPWQIEAGSALFLALLTSHLIVTYFEMPLRAKLSSTRAHLPSQAPLARVE